MIWIYPSYFTHTHLLYINYMTWKNKLYCFNVKFHVYIRMSYIYEHLIIVMLIVNMYCRKLEYDGRKKLIKKLKYDVVYMVSNF